MPRSGRVKLGKEQREKGKREKGKGKKSPLGEGGPSKVRAGMWVSGTETEKNAGVKPALHGTSARWLLLRCGRRSLVGGRWGCRCGGALFVG